MSQIDKLRKQMIDGEKPYQCGKCWNIEKDLLEAEDAGKPLKDCKNNI